MFGDTIQMGCWSCVAYPSFSTVGWRVLSSRIYGIFDDFFLFEDVGRALLRLSSGQLGQWLTMP